MGRRKRYSAEFKRETSRRANGPGVTNVLVAEELGFNAWKLAGKPRCTISGSVDAVPLRNAIRRI